MKAFISKLLFTTLLAILSIVAFSQNENCSKFKNGTFKLAGQHGDEYIITRKNGKQIEKNTITNATFEFNIEWIDDCTYKLTPDSNTQTKLKLPENTVLTISIVELTDHSYKYECASNFSGIYSKGKVIKLED